MRKTNLLIIGALLTFSFEAAADKPKPKVITLDTVNITAVAPRQNVARPKPKKKDPIKCHRENGVKVCRPESLAADKVAPRTTSTLSRLNRSIDLKSLLGPNPWFLPKSLYQRLTTPPKKDKSK